MLETAQETENCKIFTFVLFPTVMFEISLNQNSST